jgi:hypothetical protein
MPAGSGPADDWFVHDVIPTGAPNSFLSEFDLNNFANDGSSHKRSAIDIVGRGTISNAAVEMSGVQAGWGQWVTGISGSSNVYGPTLSDTSASRYAYEFSSGQHVNMLKAVATAAFSQGVIQGRSDAPSGNDDLVFVPTHPGDAAGTWWVGPQRGDAIRCGFCVTAPAVPGGPAMPTISVDSSSDVTVGGSLGQHAGAGSVHHLVFSGHGINRAVLAPLFSDQQDLASAGTASVVGRLVCTDKSRNSASWQVAVLWDLTTGKLEGTQVKMLFWSSPQMILGIGAPVGWIPSFGAANSNGIPSISVMTLLAQGTTLSCKEVADLIVAR